MKFFVLAAYVVMMIVVIAFTAKKNLSLDGFLLGGRKVGPWMSALSYGASYFSAVIIVGYAGSIGWTVGTAAIWCGIGNAVIGSFLAWRLLAKPTRVMGERLNVKTLPSFFEKRYNSKTLKIIASLIIFVFLIPYSASVYKGLGNMFVQAFGFDYSWTVVGIALLASIYLFAGGYKATAITDFIQGIIMIGGVTAIVVYILKAAGGVSEGLNLLGTDEIGGAGFNTLWPPVKQVWFFSIVILTSLGVLGMPQMIHKFFAIKDAASVKRATVISTVFAFVIAGGVYFAGSFGRVVLSKITQDGTKLIDLVNSGSMSKDMIMPTILSDATVVNIPEIMLGIFVVVLLSASISTLTALVLSSSSVITLDLIGTVVPKIKSETSVWIMRVLCIVFVIFSLMINFLMQNTSIVSLMSLSWGTIAGAFLAPFLYGLLWRGVTKIGAYSGVIGGALISLLPPLITGDMSLSPISGAAAMLAGLVIVPVVSVLTKKHAFSQEHIAMIFEDKQAA
ncbi:MAG TPA: sodium:solute symporter [Candidatus Limiplasma sp.]|nr:sodium:solute symporter [Candidatus Limiplasma sp.]